MAPQNGDFPPQSEANFGGAFGGQQSGAYQQMAYQEEPNQQQQFYPQEGMVQQNGYDD